MNSRNLVMLLALAAGLAACGGGGGGSSAPPSSDPSRYGTLSLSGVAATGAAISGGTVEIRCRVGTATTTTNADGSYTVTLAEGAQPCILKATDPVSKITLYSAVEAGATRANITPVTNLVVANALGTSPSVTFTNFDATAQDKLSATNLTAAVVRVQSATAALGTDADMSNVDIMKGTLVAATDQAAGNDYDKRIDALMASLAAADKRITDLENQLKSATSGTDAAQRLTATVGNARYALASCPYARSGDLWVLNFTGVAPVSYNANFNTMVLTQTSTSTTSTINLKRDAQGAVIPCAFTATVNGSSVEFRVSEGGVGVWKTATDFGLSVPIQKTWTLADTSFAGSFSALAFVRDKVYGYRAALPFRFDVDANGDMKGYACDMSKSKPDCLTTVDSSDADDTDCVAMSNGTFSCTSTAGLTATGIPFVSGNQVTLFMAITSMDVDGYKYGGLMVMTKSPKLSLPSVGQTVAADAAWYAGVESGTNVVVSGGSAQSTVESVNASANSYTTSSKGTTVVFTTHLDTPAAGFLFSKSTGYQGVSIGSSSGWMLTMTKGSGTEFDGWLAAVRAKR